MTGRIRIDALDRARVRVEWMIEAFADDEVCLDQGRGLYHMPFKVTMEKQ